MAHDPHQKNRTTPFAGSEDEDDWSVGFLGEEPPQPEVTLLGKGILKNSGKNTANPKRKRRRPQEGYTQDIDVLTELK